MIKWVIGGLVARESLQQVMELNERNLAFDRARQYADHLGKPLLVVGAPKHRLSHPCGDVTIDIQEHGWCDVEIADVRDIPYPSAYFGAAHISHIVEHLPTINDALLALDELHRVADKVFVISPHKTSLIAWLVPSHHLWVTSMGDELIIEQRGEPRRPSERPQDNREDSYLIGMQVF